MKNWKLWIAVVGVLGAIYFVVFHWSRFVQDFFPLDASRVAPNILASGVQFILIAIAAYLLYPPIKRAVDAYARRHLDEIKAHVSAEHAKIHARLDVHETHLEALRSAQSPKKAPTPPKKAPQKS
jgi:hypothetical protein